MKKSRFTVSQIIGILKEAEAGKKTSEICREYSITDQTFYRWKTQYGGMELREAHRLKDLEDENRRLKQLVAEQALDLQAMKAVIQKKW